MSNGIVKIHGKEYKTVALRVNEFRESAIYKGWSIMTEIVKLDDDQCVIKTQIVNPESKIVATGHAQEFRKASQINGTSYVENCETSSIGRALACLGLAGSEFASANEVVNAIHQQNNPAKEEISQADLTLFKAKLFDASKEGKLKEVFFGLKPAVQEALREYANELKRST
jgi:hypothetical protein